MLRLCDDGFEVQLETGGSFDIGAVDSRVKRIVDFKSPSSKMMKNNVWKNIDHLTSRDEVKFVIGNREDYEWAKRMIEQYRIPARCPVLMSVTFGVLDPLTLTNWVLADRLDVRFQLQMHKYVWAPETKGV